jgi:transcription initiation factor TFIIF subunit alpha
MVGPSEIVQEYGEGSEYGRAAREEARRKKYGRQTRKYDHDNQPWKLMIKDKTSDSKEKYYRQVLYFYI